MLRKLLLTLCLVLGLTFVACDSDDGEEDTTTDTAVDMGDSTGDSTPDTDTTSDVGDTADSTETTDASDTMDIPVDMGMSACAPLNETGDVTATYDAFTVLGFVGTAEVVKTGLNVLVTVEDEMFTGEFAPGSNCVPAQPLEGLLFPLCFMTPDGFPAEPETLGSVLITGPNDTIGIVAAHRRGVDRTCAAAGAYLLTPGTPVVTPMGIDQAFVDEIMAEYAQYIMVFELPEQTVAIMGQEQAYTVNPFDVSPTMDGFSDFTFMQALGGNADDWGVTVTGTTGTLNGDDMTFDLQLEVMGLENHMGVDFTINVPMTGVRQ